MGKIAGSQENKPNTITMEKQIIYPHYILLLKKLFVFLLFFTLPATAAVWFLCPPEFQFKALLGIGIGSALFLFYSALNYTHTMTVLENGGIIVRKGWIPNSQNTIFWIHIKDVNASAGALESLFGCGTVFLKVTVRNSEESVQLGFLSNYQQHFEFIRAKIAEQNKEARPMTYS